MEHTYKIYLLCRYTTLDEEIDLLMEAYLELIKLRIKQMMTAVKVKATVTVLKMWQVSIFSIASPMVKMKPVVMMTKHHNFLPFFFLTFVMLFVFVFFF